MQQFWSTLAAVLLLATGWAGAQQTAGKPSAAAPATNIVIHLDAAGTQIHFTVSSLLHSVHGSFQCKGGALALDPDSTLAQGEFLVDATTLRAGSGAEDKRIATEVLESGRYPSIFFHAEHRRGELSQTDGAADIILEGSMNIHGADHPMQLRVHTVRQGEALTATAHFVVPYVEWGMKQPRSGLLPLSRQVLVDVTAKGTIRTVATVNGTHSNDSDEETPSGSKPDAAKPN
jgi:polyisoprenoid-binding protein YceI